MQWQTILLEQCNGVGLITLNRPQALNALNNQLIVEVNQALDQLEKDSKYWLYRTDWLRKSFCSRRRY